MYVVLNIGCRGLTPCSENQTSNDRQWHAHHCFEALPINVRDGRSINRRFTYSSVISLKRILLNANGFAWSIGTFSLLATVILSKSSEYLCTSFQLWSEGNEWEAVVQIKSVINHLAERHATPRCGGGAELSDLSSER